MAYKTKLGWRNARRPETTEAVKKFENATGLKVISARCRTSGSMRPYVNLLINKSHSELWEEVRKNDFIYQINGQSFNYMHQAYNQPELCWIDIEWKKLGMAQPF